MLRLHRRLALLSAITAVLVSSGAARADDLTAAQAIARIQARYPTTGHTVDTIKAGDPSVKVTGIVTTFLDTMEVLREADRRGLNLVITHEPTFYNHPDETAFFAEDPVYKEKLDFIQQHHMVVFREHDGIHSLTPDPFPLALADALGWKAYSRPEDPHTLTIPQITLGALIAQLQARLHDPTMRVVGEPNLVVTHVALLPGAAGMQKQVLALRANADLLVAGEASEWETVEYVRDAVTQGRKKALILLGHQVSEEPGMDLCTDQLRKLFPGQRIEHIPANTPFLRLESSPK